MKKKNIINKIEEKIPKKWKKRIPNIITSSRILMALLFIFTFITGHMGISVALFATASISDAMDGFLARRWNAQSKFGKYIDPIADKLLVGSTLLLYGILFNKLMLIPLIGELSIICVNIANVIKSGDGNVNKIGKIKTISLMSTTSLALLTTILSNPILNSLVTGLVCVNLPLQAATIIEYISKFNKTENVELSKNNINNEDKNIKKKQVESTKDKIEEYKKEKDFLLNINTDEISKVKKIGQKINKNI